MAPPEPGDATARARRLARFGVLAVAACAAPAPRPSAPVDAATPPPARAVETLATPPADVSRDAPAPVTTPEPSARRCNHGERLDTGCACPDGACFDICCGPDADCAHPLNPGGPSACMLRPQPAPPTKPPRAGQACKDGESLADGCTCGDGVCMDICCVGSACTHHAGPDGGWAKCVSLPKRGK